MSLVSFVLLMSFLSQSQLILSSHYEVYISSSLCAWQFLLDASHCEFALSDAGYICIPTNSLKFNGMQLSCLKMV